MSPTVRFAKDTTNVFFHILTQCNLKCRHCYINPTQHGTGRLSIDIIKAWLDIFADPTRRANLILLGGEPTMHPELSKAVEHANALGFASITIDTNGYLFHDILEKVTPDQVDYFSFSLDGASAETNDPIRGNGSYAVCTQNARKAKKSGFQTSLIYTVSRMNIEELAAVPPLLTDLGVDRFFIQVIGLRGRSATGEQADNTILQLTRHEWETQVLPIARKVAEQGIPVSYPKVYLDSAQPFECAGRVADNYFIFPNGRVYRCPLCEDYPLHSLTIENNRLHPTAPINEHDLFELDIPEGCVMNKLVQPHNIAYRPDGCPEYQIACCLLKEEI